MSSTAGLVKLPLIGMSMVGIYAAMTPPDGPTTSKDEERSKLQIWRAVPIALKTMLLGVNLTEAMVLLASSFSSNQASPYILENFVQKGHPSDIRLTASTIIGAGLIIAGGHIQYWSFKSLGRFFTPEIVIQTNHTLVVTGPYSLVRHPGYAGVCTTVIGSLIWQFGPGSWAGECGRFSTGMGKVATGAYIALSMAVFVGAFLRASREDELLKEKFGEEWKLWAARVPSKLIPWIY